MQEDQIIFSDSCKLPVLRHPRSGVTASSYDREFLGPVLIFASQGLCGVRGWTYDPLSGLTWTVVATEAGWGQKK